MRWLLSRLMVGHIRRQQGRLEQQGRGIVAKLRHALNREIWWDRWGYGGSATRSPSAAPHSADGVTPAAGATPAVDGRRGAGD